MNKRSSSGVAGVARYEFRMQIRRKALWITMLLFGLLAFTGQSNPWDLLGTLPLTEVVATWSIVIQAFMPIAFSCLLADRIPRDRRTLMDEILTTLPVTPGAHLVGKYLGATAATLVPLLLVYAYGVGYLVANGRPEAVPLALLTFAAINLPGLLFVAAFSVACPALIWVPLYQLLFVGYWFWGNLLPPYADIPTLTGTWLTPLGEYMAVGFFGMEPVWLVDAAAWEGVVSTALLLTLGGIALLAAHLVLSRRAARQ